MRRALSAMALFLGVGLCAAGAFATPITYTTTMSGANEFPPVSTTGTGTATVILDTAAHTMRVMVSFSGLVSPTSVAHIHCCVSPSASIPTAGVATAIPTFPGFPAGVTSGSYDQTFDLTLASSWNAAFVTANGGTPALAESFLASQLALGNAYFNVHTAANTGGEIRGFFAVPEPSAALLLGTAVLALTGGRRRLVAS